MGVLYDAISLVGDIKNAANSGVLDKASVKSFMKRGKKYTSLAHRASQGTLQFPVLITSSIDIETAQNISKALERNYSTFAQIAISHTPTDMYEKDWDSTKFLAKFHQNIGLKTSAYDTMQAISNVMDSYNVYEDDEIIVFSATYESSTAKINASNAEQLFDIMEHVKHDILNNKYKPKSEVIYNFKNKDLNRKYNSVSPVTEADAYDPQFLPPGYVIPGNRGAGETLKYNQAERHFVYNQQVDAEINKINTNLKLQQLNASERDSKNRLKAMHRTVDLNKDMLKDNDVKKSNELVATTLHVRIRLVNSNDEDMGIVDFMIGIKCIMHPIKTEDMINNMVSACRNESKVFNFLRWTSGEISFFKDLVLHLGETKEDVTSHKSGSSSWWVTLKRRRNLAKAKTRLFSKQNILPNSTIVISAEEVEYIKSQFGYDLYKPIFFNKIIANYFLLGFVIVDSSAQIAHFLFENDKDFQTLTFSALEKATTNDERKFKEMLKVVNRL